MGRFSSSSYIKIDCPDGPRYILKNPEKAFSIVIADWDANIKGLLKFLADTQVEIGGEIAKKARSIVEQLTEKYASLQAHYQAAYLNYVANPCSKEAEKTLKVANAEIREMASFIREVEATNLGTATKSEIVCSSCGAKLIKQKNLWRTAKAQNKTGKRMQLEIGLYECSSCKRVFREVMKQWGPTNLETPELWGAIPKSDVPKAINEIGKLVLKLKTEKP